MDREQALTLRLNGLTYAEIAAVMGCTRQNVQIAIAPAANARLEVRKRSGQRCEWCGFAVGLSGHIHHMHSNSFERGRYNLPENLLYLCRACHRRAHTGDKLLAGQDALREAFLKLTLGLTEQTTATWLGISRSYVGHLKAGRRPITKRLAHRMRERAPQLRELLVAALLAGRNSHAA